MKRVFFVVGIFIGLVAFGIFMFGIVYIGSNEKPPTAILKVGDKKIVTTRESYCWESYSSSKCEREDRSTLELVKLKEPVIVEPNAEIKIEFNRILNPIMDRTSVFQLAKTKDGKGRSIKLNKHKFSAPKESGIYYYSLSAEWTQGRGQYVFSIKVK